MKTLLKNQFTRYKIHVICWALFIAYEIAMIGVISGEFSSPLDYLLHYTLNLLIFYFHAAVILPFALQKRGLWSWWIPVLAAGEVIAYISFLYLSELLATQFLGMKLLRPLQLDSFYLLRATWRAVYFMGFATGYYYLMTYLREKKRAEQAEKQHLLNIIDKQHLQTELIKSQHAFLKAQINPHFLFNTLSFVYNSVRKTSHEAAEAILSLSDMMRYALQSENEHQETSLLEEIEHVENLIRIHQLRHNHQLHLKLTVSKNLQGTKIIPLVLITLVENMFKHGHLTDEAHPASITISREGNTLRINTANLKSREQASGHSVGLNNIRERLEHVYTGQASLEVSTDRPGYFYTALSIPQAADPLYHLQHDLKALASQ